MPPGPGTHPTRVTVVQMTDILKEKKDSSNELLDKIYMEITINFITKGDDGDVVSWGRKKTKDLERSSTIK